MFKCSFLELFCDVGLHFCELGLIFLERLSFLVGLVYKWGRRFRFRDSCSEHLVCDSGKISYDSLVMNVARQLWVLFAASINDGRGLAEGK